MSSSFDLYYCKSTYYIVFIKMSIFVFLKNQLSWLYCILWDLGRAALFRYFSKTFFQTD